MHVGVEKGGGKGFGGDLPFPESQICFAFSKEEYKELHFPNKPANVMTLLLTETEAGYFQKSQVSYVLQQ